jgi:hypothetical protein
MQRSHARVNLDADSPTEESADHRLASQFVGLESDRRVELALDAARGAMGSASEPVPGGTGGGLGQVAV